MNPKNQQINQITKSASSFRDPNGFIFYAQNKIYRQVSNLYKKNYDFLINSGLKQNLQAANLLISHDEVKNDFGIDDTYKIIEPKLLNFISYPYEWSFSQLKDAALITLEIQKRALNFGMSLKDASAYNIQFHKGKPILIDTLSFEKYIEGKPWIAYRQFCQHFLAPLALISQKDIRLSKLLSLYIDGIPLDLASSILPKSSYLKYGLLSNIHLHAKSQNYYSDKKVNLKRYKISKFALKGIIDSLESAIKKLKWKPSGTEWAEYYTFTNYNNEATQHKINIVKNYIKKIKPQNLWDLGANDGFYSRLASDQKINTVSFDIDPASVEKNYLTLKKRQETNILPLVLDLTNPSPSIGWHNKERDSLIKRGSVDMAMGLALIHHLAISNNLPFYKIADFFSEICKHLIIEFVPKTDSQVQKLLATKEDIFPNYNQESFENNFKQKFKIDKADSIKSSKRTLYLMTNKKCL